ncbi:MAG: hypothetical protein V2B18_19535 [Pseudomonadota bacterium]
MALLRLGRCFLIHSIPALALALFSASVQAQDFSAFKSEEYGFTMRYPTSWVKIDSPKGNYYKVFQAPDLVENFRPRIHVAAHNPVKDPIEVFLTEMRNGIKDLQTRSGKPANAKDQVIRIMDEGEFKCDVPGAYFFFIQALEDKLNIWMDIVIVFYKHDQTLLRISCLAPSNSMEKFHQAFNEALVSIKFARTESAAPATPSAVGPAPRQEQEDETEAEAPPRPTTTAPAQPTAPPRPAGSVPAIQPQPPSSNMLPAPPPPPSRAAPRGPSRKPENPATGLVE